MGRDVKRPNPGCLSSLGYPEEYTKGGVKLSPELEGTQCYNQCYQPFPTIGLVPNYFQRAVTQDKFDSEILSMVRSPRWLGFLSSCLVHRHPPRPDGGLGIRDVFVENQASLISSSLAFTLSSYFVSWWTKILARRYLRSESLESCTAKLGKLSFFTNMSSSRI